MLCISYWNSENVRVNSRNHSNPLLILRNAVISKFPVGLFLRPAVGQQETGRHVRRMLVMLAQQSDFVAVQPAEYMMFDV